MIRTRDLSKRYARTEALHGLTLEVPAGSVFALIGPNGAGKSTAIKTIMNIFEPSSGSAEVLGVDSRSLGAAQLAEIGYVSENQQIPEWMTVETFLSYCRAFYPGWCDSDLAQLIAGYELPLGRRIRQLSRGMRVKTALAASLAYRPRLIVLDEPFSGLDILVREQLIESIVERTPEATVFLASHDLAEIESFATHVGYLQEGRLQFVEEMTALTERFREIEITLDAPAALPPGLPLHWWNAEQSGVVARFIDSQYDSARTDAEVKARFSRVRDVAVRGLSLRAIFLALARARR